MPIYGKDLLFEIQKDFNFPPALEFQFFSRSPVRVFPYEDRIDKDVILNSSNARSLNESIKIYDRKSLPFPNLSYESFRLDCLTVVMKDLSSCVSFFNLLKKYDIHLDVGTILFNKTVCFLPEHIKDCGVIVLIEPYKSYDETLDYYKITFPGVTSDIVFNTLLQKEKVLKFFVNNCISIKEIHLRSELPCFLPNLRGSYEYFEFLCRNPKLALPDVVDVDSYDLDKIKNMNCSRSKAMVVYSGSGATLYFRSSSKDNSFRVYSYSNLSLSPTLVGKCLVIENILKKDCLKRLDILFLLKQYQRKINVNISSILEEEFLKNFNQLPFSRTTELNRVYTLLTNKKRKNLVFVNPIGLERFFLNPKAEIVIDPCLINKDKKTSCPVDLSFSQQVMELETLPVLWTLGFFARNQEVLFSKASFAEEMYTLNLSRQEICTFLGWSYQNKSSKKIEFLIRELHSIKVHISLLAKHKKNKTKEKQVFVPLVIGSSLEAEKNTNGETIISNATKIRITINKRVLDYLLKSHTTVSPLYFKDAYLSFLKYENKKKVPKYFYSVCLSLGDSLNNDVIYRATITKRQLPGFKKLVHWVVNDFFVDQGFLSPKVGEPEIELRWNSDKNCDSLPIAGNNWFLLR